MVERPRKLATISITRMIDHEHAPCSVVCISASALGGVQRAMVRKIKQGCKCWGALRSHSFKVPSAGPKKQFQEILFVSVCNEPTSQSHSRTVRWLRGNKLRHRGYFLFTSPRQLNILMGKNALVIGSRAIIAESASQPNCVWVPWKTRKSEVWPR